MITEKYELLRKVQKAAKHPRKMRKLFVDKTYRSDIEQYLLALFWILRHIESLCQDKAIVELQKDIATEYLGRLLLANKLEGGLQEEAFECFCNYVCSGPFTQSPKGPEVLTELVCKQDSIAQKKAAELNVLLCQAISQGRTYLSPVLIAQLRLGLVDPRPGVEELCKINSATAIETLCEIVEKVDLEVPIVWCILKRFRDVMFHIADGRDFCGGDLRQIKSVDAVTKNRKLARRLTFVATDNPLSSELNGYFDEVVVKLNEKGAILYE